MRIRWDVEPNDAVLTDLARAREHVLAARSRLQADAEAMGTRILRLEGQVERGRRARDRLVWLGSAIGLVAIAAEGAGVPMLAGHAPLIAPIALGALLFLILWALLARLVGGV